MKLFQLITLSESFFFSQTFYKTPEELISDLENVIEDFPSYELELKEFISDITFEEDSIVGFKKEFDNHSFVRIEVIDTEECFDFVCE
jgi:hypothetical protein